MTWTRALEAARVPDVFPVQLLGPSHELPPTVTQEWSVEDVGAGARLVLPRQVGPWTGHGGPDPSVLSRARRDFRAILMTATDAEEERRRLTAGSHGGD